MDLVRFLPLLSIILCGCVRVPDEFWHFKDEEGRPASGVYVACEYHNPSSPMEGVNSYVSGTDGTLRMIKDEITKGVRTNPDRVMFFTYSTSLHSGGRGYGFRDNGLFTTMTLIRSLSTKNGTTILKDGSKDCRIWHRSLLDLQNVINDMEKLHQYQGPGSEKVLLELINILEDEKKLFLVTHGESIIDYNYYEYLSDCGMINPINSKNKLKFKEIIPFLK